MERNDKNNILSIKTNNTETNTILSKKFFVSYNYDSEIVNASFSDFEELIESNDVEETVSNPSENEYELKSEIEVLNFEIDSIRTNMNSLYNAFINQLKLILDNSALMNQTRTDINDLIEDSNELFSSSVQSNLVNKTITQDGIDYTININFNSSSFYVKPPNTTPKPVTVIGANEMANEILDDGKR